MAEPTPSPSAASWGARLLLLVGLAAAVWVPAAYTDAPQDDAYITYRYAENWVHGDGLVFNAGEEPVEGYTNFLWTVLIGVGMKLGVDPEWLGPWLGILCTLGAALLTARLARALGANAWFAALAVLLFAAQPTLTVHAAGGLETALFALLVVASLLPRVAAERTARGDLASGLCLAAAALTRPEGVMLFGLLELADATALLRGAGARRAWLAGVLRRAVPFGLVVGAHLLWRRATYGDWVPNTFHAKVEPGPDVWSDGYDYARAAVLGFGLLLVLVPYFALAWPDRRRARLVVLWVTTVWVVYVVYVGGDYMPTFRFFLPILPLWAALAASSLDVAGERLAGRRGAVAAAVLLVFLGSGHAWRSHGDDELFWPEQARRHEELVAAGKKLDEILPADAWLAVTNAGRIPYFSRRRCIDMMGLSDRHIARVEPTHDAKLVLTGHLKGDGRYVLDRRPDVIVFLRLVAGPRAVAGNGNWPRVVREQAFSISETQISRDPRLADYVMVSVPLRDVGAWLNVAALPGTVDAAAIPGAVVEPWP